MALVGFRGMLAACAVALALASPAKAQVVNGNFDAVVGSLPGWTVDGVQTSIFGSYSSPQNATFNAFDDKLSQTINIAVAGQYILSFFLKVQVNPDGGPAAPQFGVLQALINGNPVITGGANSAAYAQTVSTALNLNAGANTLAFTGAQFFNGAELIRLEDVQLTAVPGPLVGSGLASFALAGFGVLVGRSRRRRAEAV